MSNIKPDKNGNYTEQQWDSLPIAKRMSLCASGEYEIYPSDITDAANHIKKLESVLRKVLAYCYQCESGDVARIIRKALEGRDD
jgi:hypothetical protein